MAVAAAAATLVQPLVVALALVAGLVWPGALLEGASARVAAPAVAVAMELVVRQTDDARSAAAALAAACHDAVPPALAELQRVLHRSAIYLRPALALELGLGLVQLRGRAKLAADRRVDLPAVGAAPAVLAALLAAVVVVLAVERAAAASSLK